MNRVLDTNVVLYFLGGRLAAPLPSGDLYVSVISEIELLSYPSLTVREEKVVKEFLSSIGIADLSDEIKSRAIQIRRRQGLKIPDAIVVATAFVLRAELLTNDARLLDVPRLRCRPLPLKQA